MRRSGTSARSPTTGRRRWSFAGDGTADLTRGRGVRIDPTARVSRSILWDDVEIGERRVLDECIVTDGVRCRRRELSPDDSAARRRRRRSHGAAFAMTDSGQADRRRPRTARPHRSLPARPPARTARAARVVPLTGDASDRRYFRIIRPDGASIVLALHAGPIDFASLPFANVAELLRQMPLPVPAMLGHSDPLGIVALEDLGDVTLQAHLGAAHADRARRPLSPGGRVHRGAAAARRRSSIRTAISRTGIAFDVEKLTLGARLLREALRRGLSGRRAVGRAARRRSARSGRRSPASWPPSRACCVTATITAAI